ncbi:MAG: hypothetical protein CFE26_02795 [Verrucomicrobiales bacterium VVV1]|nr:MAG: hypothetical protein CFE26_02795 [Verrucomicrobiales bacterium VVV1]
MPTIKVLDPSLSNLVGNEILEGRLQPAVWAMALASSNGTRDEAVTHYARLRLQSLSEDSQLRKQKQDALEFRRSSGFQKLPPEPPPQARVNQRREKLGLHPFWLGSMWLAVSGACASAVRLFLSDSPLFIAHAGIAPHIALGASLVCIAAVVHYVIPKLRVFLSHVLPLVTCATALASFSFGVLILQRSMLDGSPKADAPVAKEARSQEASPSGKLLDASKEVAVKNLATAP